MRIYGHFKDYYDPALRDFESEPTPVYERNPSPQILEKHVRIGNNIKDTRRYFPEQNRILGANKDSWCGVSVEDREFTNKSIDVRLKVIGFCGKLYPLYTTESVVNPVETKPYKPVAVGYGRPICNVYRKVNPELFELNGIVQHYTWKDSDILVNNYDELENCEFLKSLFIRFHVPSFIIDFPHIMIDRVKYDVYLNPRLGDFGFHKIFSPWEAMQELNMFFGNDLVQDNTPPMPVGSDKIIAESKGFDKWSFRKPPSK